MRFINKIKHRTYINDELIACNHFGIINIINKHIGIKLFNKTCFSSTLYFNIEILIAITLP